MKLRDTLKILSLISFAVATASAQSSFSDLAKSASQAVGQQQATETKLPNDIVGGLKNLASSFNLSQLNYAALAKDALSALNVGQDSKALVALDKLEAAKLSAGQLGALKTVRTAVDTYVLQRNFSGAPAAKNLLADSLTAIKGGDFSGVSTKLQGLAASVKATPEQKAVLDSLVTHYKAWAAKK